MKMAQHRVLCNVAHCRPLWIVDLGKGPFVDGGSSSMLEGC
jgi:hypothetical protein